MVSKLYTISSPDIDHIKNKPVTPDEVPSAYPLAAYPEGSILFIGFPSVYIHRFIDMGRFPSPPHVSLDWNLPSAGL